MSMCFDGTVMCPLLATARYQLAVTTSSNYYLVAELTRAY